MMSVAVMAHRKRRRMVDRLVERLDVTPDIVWDRRDDRRDTGRRAWEAYDPAASHHLVIQDDAVPCADLVAGATRAVAGLDRPAALYFGAGPRHIPHRLVGAIADDGGYVGFDMTGPIGGVALILPTGHIPDMIAWVSTFGGDRYDSPIHYYYRRMGVLCRYTWPSLVDHRERSRNPSLAHRRETAGRVAIRFAGVDMSATAIDWAGPTVNMADAIYQRCGVPMFTWRHRKTGQLVTLDVNDRRIRTRRGLPAGDWRRVDRLGNT